jgi:hypothetical protein
LLQAYRSLWHGWDAAGVCSGRNDSAVDPLTMLRRHSRSNFCTRRSRRTSPRGPTPSCKRSTERSRPRASLGRGSSSTTLILAQLLPPSGPGRRRRTPSRARATPPDARDEQARHLARLSLLPHQVGLSRSRPGRPRHPRANGSEYARAEERDAIAGAAERDTAAAAAETFERGEGEVRAETGQTAAGSAMSVQCVDSDGINLSILHPPQRVDQSRTRSSRASPLCL